MTCRLWLCVKEEDIVNMATKGSVKKPIFYCYCPYYKQDNEIEFVEVWQVLEDEILGVLYPWQYAPVAQTSSRIETLNFMALSHFSELNKKFPDTKFIFKMSSRLLAEGNIHRLASMLSDQLIICFDIYQLEAFGDKSSRIGLNFLTKRGAHIMIEGIERAPMEVIAKYKPEYFLLDYRYYNSANNTMLSILSKMADDSGSSLVVGNVVNKTNMQAFGDNGVKIYSGSALCKPKKKLETLLTK